MHDKLMGQLFFSEKNVIGRSYMVLLEMYALPQFLPQIILQHDGAPPHFCQHIRNHLDREIGRGGPIAWPPRTPDLTPLYFFLWDYVKNIVYHVTINDFLHLKVRIRDAVAMVTPNML
jgi:hypothetical protein